MPQPSTTAKATVSAAASPNPGAGSPVLAAWLVVRRRNVLLSFAKRRYVVLTGDHVLLVDNTPVLHLVECRVSSNPSAQFIDLSPAPSAGLAVRIFADTPVQCSKWLVALNAASDSSLRRFYQIHSHTFLGAGVHGIVRSAFPFSSIPDYSVEMSAPPSKSNSPQPHPTSDHFPCRSDQSVQRRLTATRTSVPSSNLPYSTHSDHEPNTPQFNSPTPTFSTPFTNLSDRSPRDTTENGHHDFDYQQHQNRLQNCKDSRSNRTSDGTNPELVSRTRSRDLGRRLFKRRILSMSGGRTSVELDPDCRENAPNSSSCNDASAIPASKFDKRFFRQRSLPRSDAPPDYSIGASVVSLGSTVNAVGNPNVGTDQIVAVKTISRTGNGSVTVASELLFALSRLNHFAIIKVIDVFQAVSDVHIVMEHCAGGSLWEYVMTHGVASESTARAIFTPIVKAVGYLHASGIVHWDVNPQNVLLLTEAPPYEPKLIDFGTARPIDPDNGRVLQQYEVFGEKGKVASLGCASPELLTSKGHRYAAKADMWQLGCVLYFLLFGELPFSRRGVQNDGTLSSRILTFCKQRSPQRREFLFGREMSRRAEDIGEDAKLLIVKLLCPNPHMRPNALQCLREYNYLISSKS